jgi:hypothetical protein
MPSTLRKNASMQRIEETHGERLEVLIPRLINADGMRVAAIGLGISTSTLNYWCLKLGIVRQTVALVPGERLEIRGTPRFEGD